MSIFEQPERVRKELIALLFKMVRSDHTIDQKEWAYILQVAETLGLDEGQVHEIFSNKEIYVLHPPKSERERMTILYYLLFLMKIDGHIDQREKDLIREYGFKLGFRTAMTDEMIVLIQDHAQKKFDTELMLDKIRKYSN